VAEDSEFQSALSKHTYWTHKALTDTLLVDHFSQVRLVSCVHCQDSHLYCRTQWKSLNLFGHRVQTLNLLVQLDLAEKVETCFSSLDQKIGACFNSLDNKMELRFNHVNAGVTQTKDAIQVVVHTLFIHERF
jgi:hypothetical protein